MPTLRSTWIVCREPHDKPALGRVYLAFDEAPPFLVLELRAVLRYGRPTLMVELLGIETYYYELGPQKHRQTPQPQPRHNH
jgi:hypothetical protein